MRKKEHTHDLVDFGIYADWKGEYHWVVLRLKCTIENCNEEVLVPMKYQET